MTIDDAAHPTENAPEPEQPLAPSTVLAEPLAPGWQLLWVDPATLVIGANTRTDAALGKEFLASIADRGVREPVTVRRDRAGQLVVRKGQRRTLAAVRAGLEAIPVIVQRETVSEEDTQQVDRIIDQLGENLHRAGLPDTDEVTAHQQLQALGLTAGQIARRTRTKPARVRTTLAVAGSELAAAALGRYQLTLDQAAAIAEFDQDPETVKALVAAARTAPGQFAHVAQRARDARAEARLREELLVQLAADNVRVVDRPDRYGSGPVRALDQLRTSPDAEPGSTLSAEDHAGCPGHVAWLESSWYGEDPVSVGYGCENWALHGHAERHAALGQATVRDTVTGPASGGMSEEQKTERRQVIANNKEWVSATRVRRAWLREFLARRTAPKDAAVWIAAVLAEGSHDVRRAMEDQHSVARELLGLSDVDGQPRWYRGNGAPHPIAAAAQTAGPARATVLTLALLLAALEAGTGKHTWRSPTRESVSYLTALAHWGYQLSEVEQLAIATGSGHGGSADPVSEDEPDTDTAQEQPADDDRAA